MLIESIYQVIGPWKNKGELKELVCFKKRVAQACSSKSMKEVFSKEMKFLT